MISCNNVGNDLVLILRKILCKLIKENLRVSYVEDEGTYDISTLISLGFPTNF